jgi:hypothetical protein
MSQVVRKNTVSHAQDNDGENGKQHKPSENAKQISLRVVEGIPQCRRVHYQRHH